MKKLLLILALTGLLPPGLAASPPKETLVVAGLEQPVEILRDPWGIAHIYADNLRDLFFAQGYSAARDRLFQLEIWRRQATGTLAEIQGRKALQRDIGARLFSLRLDLQQEFRHYHPDGEEIITSFVRGINARIDHVRESPDLLPLELRLLGVEPGYWTPEIVLSRHNGLYRNVTREVEYARLAPILGLDRLRSLLYLEPEPPELTLPEGVDPNAIPENVLELYQAFRAPVRFAPEDVVDPTYRSPEPEAAPEEARSWGLLEEPEPAYGSNNWLVAGSRTLNRRPFMANDPHRAQQIPSLRYWVHLVAPGWNVIGAGEPALPGVAIGHNGHGAWGLTVFSIDQEDLYVYETHPQDPDRYRYRDGLEAMQVIRDVFSVRGESPVEVDLKFTRHGPVIYEDEEGRKAYAIRAAWLEVGTAPYLASLRMNQAQSWEEFRKACAYFRIPGENMIWADAAGNIGWQAVGITPVRKNWNGLFPVPGDGRYEWDGFLPIEALPHTLNPPQDYFATANEFNVPDDYPFRVGFRWAEPFRFARLSEVLGGDRKMTLADMIRLQLDELSIPARTLVPFLKGLRSSDPRVQRALEMLRDWDFVLDQGSVTAGIYIAWERRLKERVWDLYLPEEARRIFQDRSTRRVIEWLTAPDRRFGEDPLAGRDRLLLDCLEEAIQRLAERLGPDVGRWQYGQGKFHHIQVRHALSASVTPELRARLDTGPLPRGGSGYTVNNTGNSDNQTSGASFRIIVEAGNWDHAVGTNTPGQSGDPESPHYRDLFPLWAQGRYFPVLYSREKVEGVARQATLLVPPE